MPTHTEKRIMPYTAKQMYDLVADVETYPDFLPWCAATRIRKVTKDSHKTKIEADLIIAASLGYNFSSSSRRTRVYSDGVTVYRTSESKKLSRSL